MMTSCPRRAFFAVMLIIAGALLFLDNLGVLPVRNLSAYWPVLLVVYGLSILIWRRSVHGLIWSMTLVASGVVLTLSNLHVWIVNVKVGDLWPLLLIAFGALMLTRRGGPPPAQWERMRHRRPHLGSSAQTSFHGNRLDEGAVLSALNRRLDTQAFEGGKLDAVFGSMEVDLSGAAITSPTRNAEIEVNAVFGGIEITIPRTWRVIIKSTSVFGSCEDKTVPPRPEPGFEPPSLVVTGGAVFGSVTIRN
jgi:hypothetical protein